MRNLRNNKGFTLIELMIVVVIIGILAAIAIPRFTAVSQTAKQAEAGPILRQICSLAEADNLRNSTYPTSIDAITGWSDPGAQYFTFEFAGGTATANLTQAGTDSGLEVQTMACEVEDEEE